MVQNSGWDSRDSAASAAGRRRGSRLRLRGCAGASTSFGGFGGFGGSAPPPEPATSAGARA